MPSLLTCYCCGTGRGEVGSGLSDYSIEAAVLLEKQQYCERSSSIAREAAVLLEKQQYCERSSSIEREAAGASISDEKIPILQTIRLFYVYSKLTIIISLKKNNT